MRWETSVGDKRTLTSSVCWLEEELAWKVTRQPVKLVEPVVGMGSCPGYQL